MRLFSALVLLLSLSVPAGESLDPLVNRSPLECDASALKKTLITPVLQQSHVDGKNVLWCSTIQFAWDGLSDYLKAPVELVGDAPYAKALNEKLVSKNDLDAESYVARAGRGSAILDEIRKDLSDKFKGEAKPRLLPETLPEGEIFAYAFLFKSLNYTQPFKSLPRQIDFRGEPVRGFGIQSDMKEDAWLPLAKQVVLHHYTSRAEFVLSLRPKQQGEQVIIAKLKPKTTLFETVHRAMELMNRPVKLELKIEDYMEIPAMNFDITRNFTELRGKLKGSGNAFISNVVQNIRLQFDEAGVLLRSEGAAWVPADGPEDPPKPRELVCDGPFLLMLKRADARMPYFALWVDNAELLVTEKNPVPPGQFNPQ